MPRKHAAAAALFCALVLALAACGGPQTRPSGARPPAKPPRSVPTTPTPTTPVTPEPNPRGYGQDARDARQALVGSSRDSLPPAEVGYYMDVLHGRLKPLASGNIGVGRQRNLIVIVLTGNAGFEPGSSIPNAGMRQTLARLAPVLLEYRKTTVSVRLRGDDTGAKSGNPQLAGERRLAVADALNDAGITNKRIVVAGPPARPAPPAKSSPASALHVELQLEPIVRSK